MKSLSGAKVALGALIVLSAYAQSAFAQSSAGSSEPALEYQLAVINKGHYVNADDITVVRFRYLLNSLASKTTSSKQEIADITVKARQIARDEYGKQLTILGLMEDANRAIPTGSSVKVNYKEIIAIILVQESQ